MGRKERILSKPMNKHSKLIKMSIIKIYLIKILRINKIKDK